MKRRNYNSTPPSDARKLSLLMLAALISLILVGCGRVSDVTRATPLSAGQGDPAYILTLELKGGETPEAIEEETGGHVRVFRPNEYALVGLDSAPLQMLDETSSLDVNSEAFVAGAAMAEMNGSSVLWAGGSSVLWAGGSSVLWAGGSSVLWAGGSSVLWAGGEEDVFVWMPQNTALWHQVNLQGAQKLASNLGDGVTVAVIDTGVDLDHPALRDGLAPSSTWWDFVGDDAIPQEDGSYLNAGYGHGTNVAGIIRQMAPRAQIMPIKVLNSEGAGLVADLSEAIAWAVDHGADVINLSLGAGHRLSAVDAALKSAARAGVLIFASTGNTNDQKVTYPASATQTGEAESVAMLSVTSVGPSDTKSPFSTYHPRIELSAPGEAVWGPAPELQMAAWSGTSMAAPMAAGAAALALGEELRVDRLLLAELLKDYSSNIYVGGANSKYYGKLGEGRLDVEKFLKNVVDSGGGLLGF